MLMGMSSSPLMRWADEWAEWYNRRPYTRRFGLAWVAFPMLAVIWVVRRVRIALGWAVVMWWTSGAG
jgi:hypothetical protein